MMAMNQKHPTSRIDLISTKLIWALIPIPVVVALSGLIDLKQADMTQPQVPTLSATVSSAHTIDINQSRDIGAPNNDEVQYFQDRAAQLRTTPSE